MESFSVLPELETLLPPLTHEAHDGLERNLLARGCLYPLVVWGQQNVLIDGHNRYKICQKHGIPFTTKTMPLDNILDVKLWIIDHALHQRNLTTYEYAELALTKEPLIAAKAKENLETPTGGKTKMTLQNSAKSKVDTRAEIAKDAGVSHDTIHRVKTIKRHADEETQEKLRAGKTTINAEYKKIKKEQQKEGKAQRKTGTINGNYELHHCAIEDALDLIPPNSIDHIITDPPYPQEFLPLYAHLFEFAEHALKNGGNLITMVGQSYLPEILKLLSESSLTYQWMLSYLTPGGQAVQLWDRKVNSFYKPLLWCVKGEYQGDWIGDVCKSNPNDNDKTHHHWGQSESGMADIVQRFTDVQDTICDPFLGGGTTGIVAITTERNFIGIDNDMESIKTSEKRYAS